MLNTWIILLHLQKKNQTVYDMHAQDLKASNTVRPGTQTWPQLQTLFKHKTTLRDVLVSAHPHFLC